MARRPAKKTTKKTTKKSGRAKAPVRKKPVSRSVTPRRRRRAALRRGDPIASLIGKVNDVLDRVKSFPVEISPCLDLRRELGLIDPTKRALSEPFQEIARAFKPDARISDDECSALKIVEDCYVLVAAKAGMTHTKVCK